MWRNLLTKIFLCLFMVCIFLNAADAQTPPPLTEERVKKLIQDEWDARRDTLIDQVIASLDFSEEFKGLTGITVGAVIAIFIVIVIVPNLIILLLIFLCCYFCKCGVFYRGKSVNNYYSQQQPTASPSYAPMASTKPVGPAVPPKPNMQAHAPNSQQSSGMWPWGKEASQENGWNNRNQGGIQNQAYNNDQW